MTVDVQYVDSDTYLGVYKYTLSSDNIQLIQEVEAGFTGEIKTTVDIRTEIYVQMHPNGTSGSAIFDVRSKKPGDDDNGIIVTIIVVLIVVGVIVGAVGLGIFIIYKKCWKSRNSTQSDPPNQPPVRTQLQMVPNNENMYYTHENQVAMDIANLEILGEDEAALQHTLPPISIKQKNEVESKNKSLRLPDPARRM